MAMRATRKSTAGQIWPVDQGLLISGLVSPHRRMLRHSHGYSRNKTVFVNRTGDVDINVMVRVSVRARIGV